MQPLQNARPAGRDRCTLLDELCAAKLALVRIPDVGGKPVKGPTASGWNKPRSQFNPNGYSSRRLDFGNGEGFNIGLHHGGSGTLALDLDNVELARKVFEELTDIHLQAWLESDQRVEIKSPKANRGKLIFKLPTGFEAPGVKKFSIKNDVVFELRCGLNQDVVIGRHPEGGEYQLIGDPAAIPEAPAVLLDMLTHWDAWKPCFDSVFGINQPKIEVKQRRQPEQVGGSRSAIDDFNTQYTVVDILTRNGYQPRGRDRFIRPGSQSKAPGATIMRNCADGVERIYSHGGDDLNDGWAHDAFDIYRILECGGDEKVALGWNPELTKHNQRLYMQEKARTQKSESPAPAAEVVQDIEIAAPVTQFIKPDLIGVDVRDGTDRTRPLTEAGNAQRINDKYGEVIRYVPEAKTWMHWDEGRWIFDADGSRITGLAIAISMSIYQEGGNFLADSEYFVRWARKSQESKTINAGVSLLKSFGSLRVPMSFLDSDQFLIGVNGSTSVVDLRTGSSRPARKNDLITKSSNAARIGDPAKAVRWLQFLNQVFDGDKEIIDWVHRFCGYLLTGSTREQFFVFCYGHGANGKSVFAEIIKYILGDYARAVQVETLCESRRQAGSATPDIAALIGARLALSTETEDGAALAESLVKALVSGDSMTARNLHKDPVEFIPQFKLLMLGNHKPMIRGSDHGIWRRIRLLPFAKTFTESERDPNLIEKLKLEVDDIFAWMVDGCREWINRGLADTPSVISRATADYRADQDIIGQWIGECCIVSPALECPLKSLYQAYREWAVESGFKPCSNISLGRRLSDRGFSERKSHGSMIRVGISLKPSVYGHSETSRGFS